MTDQNRAVRASANIARQVRDDPLNAQLSKPLWRTGDDLGGAPALQQWPCRRVHLVAGCFERLPERVPRLRRHPSAVNQDNGSRHASVCPQAGKGSARGDSTASSTSSPSTKASKSGLRTSG